MIGMMLLDPKTGSKMMVDVPDILPKYAMGTTVCASILDGDSDQLLTITGDIIGIEVTQEMDMKENTISTVIGYKVLREDSKEVYYIDEEEIYEYYPETNEFDPDYHFNER